MELEIELMTYILGFTIFAINLVTLFFYGRLFRGTSRSRDKRGIIIQMTFVSFIDMLSGFVLFMIGLTSVSSTFTAYLCAYVIYTGMVLQTVSQGNITCIFAQRYISARNIRKLSTNKQALQTKILTAVNIVIGGLSLLCHSLTSRVKDISEITFRLCSLSSILRREAAQTSAAFFVLGVVFTIVADILCCMTILRLRSEVNVVVQPSVTTVEIATEPSQENESLRISMKKTQQKALMTLFLILVFVNLSVLPTIIVYSLIFSGVYLSLEVRRIFLISFFFNSLINPIILVFRTEEIRASIRKGLRCLFAPLHCCT